MDGEKITLMEGIHQDELEFFYYQKGTAGSFREGLYNLYWKADTFNRIKLESVFPYLWVANKYSTEPGYWEELQQRIKQSQKI